MGTTNRILEFTPSQEEAVVSRVLVLVHQAVDESFPGVEKASRQFTKTVFSAEGENTALSRPPASAFGSDEVTSPGGRPMPDSAPSSIPPSPAKGAAASSPGKPRPPAPSAALAGAAASVPDATDIPTPPRGAPLKSSGPTRSSSSTSTVGKASAPIEVATGLSDMTAFEKPGGGVDRQVVFWVVMLIAGLAVLAYAAMSMV